MFGETAQEYSTGESTLIAAAHSMLIATYHILKDLQPYKELGCDYYNICNHEKIIQRNIRSLERLGVKVVIGEPSAHHN